MEAALTDCFGLTAADAFDSGMSVDALWRVLLNLRWLIKASAAICGLQKQKKKNKEDVGESGKFGLIHATDLSESS